MITATVLAIFLVPAFFVAVLRRVEARRPRTQDASALLSAQPASGD
jgi:hypothetical protein